MRLENDLGHLIRLLAKKPMRRFDIVDALRINSIDRHHRLHRNLLKLVKRRRLTCSRGYFSPL